VLTRFQRGRLVLVCLFLLSLPAITPRLYSSDEVQYFAYLRSLWFDHDLSFENEYQHFYDAGIARSDGFHETFLERTTETGRRINFGTLGCAILWAPFYAVGDVVAHAAGAPLDGYSKPYVSAVAYGSAVYGFAAVLLGIACAERLGFAGLIPGLMVWVGTPLLFYMYVAPPFSHACSAFAVALFVTVWLRVRERWTPGGLFVLGVTAALMAMVREQDAFFVVGPAADFLVAPGRRTTIPAALAGIAGGVLAYAPQALAYLRLNGHLGPHASVEHKMSWSAPHVIQVLVSPEHGYFLWTPLAAIGIGGLIVMASHADLRRIALCMLLMVAFQVYIGGSVESWTVAGGFGQRRFVALSVLLIVGLAAGFSALAARAASSGAAVRRTAIAIAVVAVYWNIALSAEFAIGLMDRQRLQPARNAYDAFVTIPREAPSLAYRYLFDRQSFYASSGSR
jgi:hypothetical protein